MVATRKGAPHGLNARGDETDLGYGPEGWTIPLSVWGGTKETGVLTRALAGNLRFRQTSSALGRTFIGPPFVPLSLSTSHSLPLCHPLGAARPRFQGMEVRSASLHIDCGEKRRAPASVLVLDAVHSAL